MSLNVESLVVGEEYSRAALAVIWGYKSLNAISRGVVTPAGIDIIILFVTKEKRSEDTQYFDFIRENVLHWEGEEKHGSDMRIINAEDRNERIILFFRDKHRLDFKYYGQIELAFYELKENKPSRFIFKLPWTGDNEIQAAENASCAHQIFEQI